ncbi:hypothetical protein CS022_17145 [Veronia nyctiphanis]|uniref:Uncharacterized protein n=1 Tax=Veronia nyctiphanis TaxID=1278244 RepID=A0A4Q0YTE2_9GAMM|nr:hypothetical protein [Veronia nyctiphanis]RXJ72271.1 hypothetical protein CS022_17145 [Veronia nyctiphanis]
MFGNNIGGGNYYQNMMQQYMQQNQQQQGLGFNANFAGLNFGGQIGGGVGNSWYQDFLTQKNEQLMFQQQLQTMLLNHENAMNKSKSNAVIESNKIASEHVKAKQNIANDYQSSTYDNSLKNIQKVSQANGRYL